MTVTVEAVVGDLAEPEGAPASRAAGPGTPAHRNKEGRPIAWVGSAPDDW
ncbi:hypothetical protein [Streptomyces sp. NPDC052042]